MTDVNVGILSEFLSPDTPLVRVAVPFALGGALSLMAGTGGPLGMGVTPAGGVGEVGRVPRPKTSRTRTSTSESSKSSNEGVRTPLSDAC